MAKDNPIFITAATKALKLTKKLNTRTAKMLDAFSHGNVQEAYEMALENERDTEKLALLYRQIPIHTGRPSAIRDMEEIIHEEVPVEMGFTPEGWFVLRIPRLLPRKERGKGSFEYIRGFLYPAMHRFFQDTSPVQYDDCVIIYRHIYDPDTPERQYRDHDNIEINFVTDTVALFVMKDDAPLCCQHHYCSAAGTRERTEVYVVPETDFVYWYEASKDFPDEGVKLQNRPLF